MRNRKPAHHPTRPRPDPSTLTLKARRLIVGAVIIGVAAALPKGRGERTAPLASAEAAPAE